MTRPRSRKSVKSPRPTRRRAAARVAVPVAVPLAVQKRAVAAGRTLWLAGLGAAVSALEGAAGAFEALVEKGRHQEPRAKAVADRVLSGARAQADGLGELARGAARRGRRELDQALARIGAGATARPKNLLHRLGDLAEAIL